MISRSEFYRFPAVGVAGLCEVDHDLSRAAAAEGAVREIIPRILDHRQQRIDVGLFRAEKLDQIDKALAGMRLPVVLVDQLLDVPRRSPRFGSLPGDIRCGRKGASGIR